MFKGCGTVKLNCNVQFTLRSLLYEVNCTQFTVCSSLYSYCSINWVRNTHLIHSHSPDSLPFTTPTPLTSITPLTPTHPTNSHSLLTPLTKQTPAHPHAPKQLPLTLHPIDSHSPHQAPLALRTPTHQTNSHSSLTPLTPTHPTHPTHFHSPLTPLTPTNTHSPHSPLFGPYCHVFTQKASRASLYRKTFQYGPGYTFYANK